MKKLTLLFVLAVCAVMVQAASCNYLVFTNTNGTTTAFSVAGLTLSVDGTNLQVTNNEGTTNLVLTDLESMQFSENEDVPSGIENVLNADQPLQVFTISGTALGSFGSLVEATQSLDAGVYVISNGRLTQTIIVK